jgi:hypothetical protein
MVSPSTSNLKRGSLLIEISLALAIFSITFVALSSLTFIRQESLTKNIEKRNEIFTLASALEMMRATSTDALYDFSSVHSITPCLVYASASGSTTSFSTLIADTIQAQNLDGDCNGLYPNNISFKKSPLLQQTDLAKTNYALDIIQNTLYIGQTEGPTSTLTVYTINNFSSPLGSTTISSKANDLDATKNFVYIAATGSNNQFITVDISDKTNPTVVSTQSLPSVAGSYPSAISIRYYNNKIYVGTHRTAGREFHVYDVASNIPTWQGFLELNHNINNIVIREPYAYLATSGNTKDLIILDIHNPRAPVIVSTLDLPGNEDSLSLFLSGNTLYLGRKKSIKTGEPDFVIISIQDPEKPILIGEKIFSQNVTNIHVIDTIAFLTLENTSSFLTALDVADSKNILEIWRMALPFQNIQSDFEEETLYTTSENTFLTALKFSQ